MLFLNQPITRLELHLLELRYNSLIFMFNFFYLFLICYYFSDELIYLSVQILVKKNMLKFLIFTNITEIFVTNFFLSFVISFFISIQLFIIQFWFFISKGLYKRENLNFIKFYIIFLIFNIFIILTILIKIIPNIWLFFLSLSFSNQTVFNIYFEPKLSNYFNFIFFSFTYLYIIFLYFFIFFYLVLNNIIKIKLVIFLRKLFYFQFLIIATLISPPDFYYQLFIFSYLIIFFEIFIISYLFLSKYLNHF